MTHIRGLPTLTHTDHAAVFIREIVHGELRRFDYYAGVKAPQFLEECRRVETREVAGTTRHDHLGVG